MNLILYLVVEGQVKHLLELIVGHEGVRVQERAALDGGRVLFETVFLILQKKLRTKRRKRTLQNVKLEIVTSF